MAQAGDIWTDEGQTVEWLISTPPGEWVPDVAFTIDGKHLAPEEYMPIWVLRRHFAVFPYEPMGLVA